MLSSCPPRDHPTAIPSSTHWCMIRNQTRKQGELKARDSLKKVSEKGKYPLQVDGSNCSEWTGQAPTCCQLQIDFPTPALPRSSTAPGSWIAQAKSLLVMDFFSWCFLLLLLPICFPPKLDFLTCFGSTDHPWRASPVLVGAVRGFQGW